MCLAAKCDDDGDYDDWDGSGGAVAQVIPVFPFCISAQKAFLYYYLNPHQSPESGLGIAIQDEDDGLGSSLGQHEN